MSHTVLDHVLSQHDFGDSGISLRQWRVGEKTGQKTYKSKYFPLKLSFIPEQMADKGA